MKLIGSFKKGGEGASFHKEGMDTVVFSGTTHSIRDALEKLNMVIKFNLRDQNGSEN